MPEELSFLIIAEILHSISYENTFAKRVLWRDPNYVLNADMCVILVAFYLKTLNSVLRFIALPSGVLLVALGLFWPNPKAINLSALTPLYIRCLATELALSLLRDRLSPASPILSV